MCISERLSRLQFILMFLLTAVFGYGNAVSAADIRGRLVDAATDEALIQASVRLLAGKDSALVTGAVTNDKGAFRLKNVKTGSYIIECSYVGYTTEFRPVRVAYSDVRLGAIKLSESSIMLAEATVTGIRTPVKVSQDTIEFNADSYKTQPNAVVEDLLKRLPGVEVNSEGKITANGKEVTKILVDGKEFFADDPTVASRNLPVNMVEKLQVVDRKSDLARMTGVDDGEDETVINLTVKKDMNNGWFGNVEAGYGTDKRYAGNFTVNRFWNGNQLTLLGAANNTNDPGFADGASGRFRRFGGSNGITTSQSVGLNFNVGNEDIFRVGGNVLYSHTDRDTRTSRERQYLLGEETSRESSQSVSRDRGHNMRADFRLQWKPDTLNSLEFRPNVSLNWNDSQTASQSSTFGAGDAGELVRSINRGTSSGHSMEFGGSLIYNHNFASRRGRSFSVYARYRMSNVRENSDTYSRNRFFLLDSADVYDQWADNHTWSNTVMGRLSWTEPLGNPAKGNFLTLSYRIQYRWNNADKLTYDRPVSWPDGYDGEPVVGSELDFNGELSNRFRNDYMNQEIRVGYKHTGRRGNLDAGLAFVPQMSKSVDLINPARNISRNVFNYAPFLRYRLRFNKSRSLHAFYNGRSSEPSMTQLQPVEDKSDPMRIVVGNPDLKPTFTHSLHFRFQDFNQESQRSIMAMVFANLQQNAIVSRTDFDNETGGQRTTYANVDGVWSVRGMNMISLPLPRYRALTFNNHLMLSYNSTTGYNNGRLNRAGTFGLRESFGIAWRPENIEFELRPTYSLQNTVNSVQRGANRTVHTYGGTFYGTYYTPFGLVVNTDLSYDASSGYSSGYDTKTWTWNASLSYQFLRDRSATVSLKAFDILGQRSNVQRTVTANYIDDALYNSLTRYFMVSVSYKFNTFGKGKMPEDRNAPRFGDGPPPGAPRPPRGAGGPTRGGHGPF